MLFVGCGKVPSKRMSDTNGDSIINGIPVEKRESAASKSVVMVEIMNADNQRLGFCSGTLIESNIVLTAAHCFDLRLFPNMRKFNVLFVNSLRERSPAVARKGVAYSLSASYNSEGVLDHDIAVLLFQNSAPSGFAPVRIDENVNANYGSKVLFVYGYGRTVDYNGNPNQPEAPNPGVLHRGLMIVDSDYNRYPDRYLTKLDSETTICQGDSGGPQFFNERNVLKVVGVNSAVFGRELPNGKRSCKSQGQATKVARFAPWIKKEIKGLKKKYSYELEPEEELISEL
jgi:tryptase